MDYRYTFLNTSIITSPGLYELKPVTLTEVVTLLNECAPEEIQSAIGHDATAQIISELTGAIVPVNRIQYTQKLGEVAIVFKLKGRAPEGVILSREEIEKIGYEWFTLTKRGE